MKDRDSKDMLFEDLRRKRQRERAQEVLLAILTIVSILLIAACLLLQF